MSNDFKTYIQEVPFLTEQQARSLKVKIYNQPMSIPYKVNSTPHFLTPSVDKNNHHLRVIFGDEKELNKYFINPKRKLLKKTFSKKGANVEFKDLHDHSVFLINYKEDFNDKMEDFIDKIKQSKENFYNALLTEFTEIENEIKEEFNDLKEDLNKLKTKWKLFIAENPVDKVGIHLEQAGKTFKKNLKTETETLLQNLHDKINSQPNEEPQKQFRKRKFCKTYDEFKVFNSACEIFNKSDIQTGMIYYYYKEKFYCIYQGDDEYLKACDELIESRNQQFLAKQNQNTYDYVIKKENTHARNQRGNNIQLFKKALIVVSILITAGLIIAATVFFSPFIGLALIPVLVLSSLGLYKVCKNMQVVSVNNSLSEQLPKFRSKYVQDRVISEASVGSSPAGPFRDPKVDNNPNLNDDRTNTTSLRPGNC
ncbi:MAG TPA: hypothetical protein VGH95_00825 [Candidatus Aquirickettsiella sp.]|jgi:hypothetical protein